MIKYYTFYKNTNEEDGPLYEPRDSRIATYENIITNIKEYKGEEKLKILDVGGGISMARCSIIPENWSITSTSLHKSEIGYTETNFTCIEGNILDLPIESETYDVTIAVLTLQYVTNQPWAISELLRVTKIGGLVIITYDHADGPTSSQYLNILNSHGLENLARKMGSLGIRNSLLLEEDVQQSIYYFVKTKNNEWKAH